MSKRALRIIVVGAATIVASWLPLTAAEAVGVPPRLAVRHTTPAATAEGMQTSAVVATTCQGRPGTCYPIHIQLTYVFVDEDGVTRHISVPKVVPAGGGTVDFVYPDHGEFVRITAAQAWCDAVSVPTMPGSCGTSRASSEALPVPAPSDLG